MIWRSRPCFLKMPVFDANQMLAIAPSLFMPSLTVASSLAWPGPNVSARVADAASSNLIIVLR